jgi:mannose-6-phosphate isomerase-like protein (cupin superfamily)
MTADIADKFLAINGEGASRAELAAEVVNIMTAAGYSFAEIETGKPWGEYFTVSTSQAKKFIADFFGGDADIAMNETSNLEEPFTPKLLLYFPGKRNSWQYHERRGETWRFLTKGAYFRSMDDNIGKRVIAEAGNLVSIAPRERHRIIGAEDGLTFVAEIWKHSRGKPSREDDIVRLEDDFARPLRETRTGLSREAQKGKAGE